MAEILNHPESEKLSNDEVLSRDNGMSNAQILLHPDSGKPLNRVKYSFGSGSVEIVNCDDRVLSCERANILLDFAKKRIMAQMDDE